MSKNWFCLTNIHQASDFGHNHFFDDNALTKLSLGLSITAQFIFI